MAKGLGKQKRGKTGEKKEQEARREMNLKLNAFRDTRTSESLWGGEKLAGEIAALCAGERKYWKEER